ncbi:phenylacetate--CoA ligase family protein [Labilibaculum euxinus]|uniref:phenylacetate--CoA ligase family protein n=1 Tax=Labilibaculum euxinus TaxID=2686357 RepID=UPI000FF20DF5|nr:phenylacetate--CoA ligase family protein [Labilibaculum euxinus]MDQ1769214.1 phenylacetate--CoA ligase family protein [Labilibaculum euxinus]
MNYRALRDYLLSKIKFGYRFSKELQRIADLYSISESQLLELKNQEFVKQYQNAFTNSKFYNKLYQEHGLNLNSIQSTDDAKLIPIITKEDIRHRVDELLTCNKLFVYTAYTSGTTGSPLKLYRDYQSVCKEYSYGYYFQSMHGYQLGDKVISIKGDLDQSEISRYDRSLNTLHLSSYNLNEKNIKKYYRLIKDFSPKVVKAYPSSLQILSVELYKAGLDLQIPLAFTSSEVLHDFQRSIIEKVLHTKIFDWYGNSEQTISLGQVKKDLYQDIPLYAHIEVQEKCIITTGFINKSFPLIRYKIDDVIKLKCDSSCIRCCTSRILGRDNQYVLLKNGQQIGLLDHAFNFSNVKNILGAQIVQNAAGEIDLNIIPDYNFTETNKANLIKNLTQLLGADCKINYKEIGEDQIIRTVSGKYNLMVSNLNSQKGNQVIREIMQET